MHWKIALARTLASATGDATSASATCMIADAERVTAERDGRAPAWKASAPPRKSAHAATV